MTQTLRKGNSETSKPHQQDNFNDTWMSSRFHGDPVSVSSVEEVRG